jgi:sulfoxide reductase heme-binding subunit YedZ
MYAAIHVLIFLDLDYGLAWSLIFQSVFEKPYILVGAASFLMLIPLAVTSFDTWKVRLKKNWKRLHKTVYFIAPLVVLHFAWSKKGNILQLQGDILRPLVYGLFVLLLLVMRIPRVRKGLSSFRTRTLVPLFQRKPQPNA